MLATLLSLARALFGRERLETDMNDELRFHLQAYTEDLVRSGVAREEAERRARLEFGSLERTRQECRESRGLRWPDEFARNVRYALRTLRKSPGFTIASVVTLALCIGANTAIFSVIDAVLLRPVPYPAPDRLKNVVTGIWWHGAIEINNSQDGKTWEMLRDHATSVDVAAMSGGGMGVNLAVGRRAEYVDQNRVTAGYFRVLGVPPAIGREFTKEEDRSGGPAGTVLSHALWMRLFGGDPRAVGSVVLLRGEPHTIVGVMPEGFRPIFRADLWTPLRPSTTGEGEGDNYGIIARLRGDADQAQAAAELEALGARIGERSGAPKDVITKLMPVPLGEGLSVDMRKPLLLLWGAVGLVLLIGCLNIAGLLLVRAAGRTREIATRVALGGDRGAVIRQLLTESLVMAAAGGLAGALVGYGGIRILSAYAHDMLGAWQEMRLDWRVLAMTALLSIITSVVFGLLPAIKAARLDVRTGLVEGGGRGIAGGTSQWPRRVLVFGEVAIGMVLLAGAGLMIRSFVDLLHAPPGFDRQGVVRASLSLQDARYRSAESVNRLFDETLRRIRALPGVQAAGVGLGVPYERWLNLGFRRREEIGTGAHSTITSLNYITPGYLRALRIPVLAGRDIDDRDNAAGARVALINRVFAERYLKGRDPLGETVLIAGEKTPLQIVGVTGNVQLRPGFGSDAPLAVSPTIYVPASQLDGDFFELVHTWFSPSWVVRGPGATEALIAGMRQAVEQAAPLLPFASFRGFDDERDRSLASQRLETALLASLAGLALVLTLVGVYALIANSAAQRTREMGIRMALGATLGRVILAVALPGLTLAAAGVVAGSLAAWWSVRALKSAVYGLGNIDPFTFGTVCVMFLCVAAAATFLPALAMRRVNPASTLREE